MKLALTGYGNVGRALAGLLEQKRKQHPFRITGLHTARHGTVICPEGVSGEPEFGPALPSHEDFLDAAKADVLVELTTLNPVDGEPAISHIRGAFARGMHVATANKGPVAFAYHELSTEARNRGLKFLYESSTMDGTPVYNLVRNCLPELKVLGFAGALNSTSKVIVEAMEHGHSLEDGIEAARRQGITEADPWFDIDGWDSACKAAALANVLMDARTTPARVDRKGIGKLTPEKVAEAAAKGKAIVLVSRAKRGKDGVSLRVRAEVLDRSDILASMRGTSNVLQLETDLMGTLGVYSVNPGVQQTAYGVFSDLVEISRSTGSRGRAPSA